MSDTVLIADDQPVDPDDELLVAYLDDELNDADRTSVEKRLVADVDFQRRLQSLQSGWEWLDELPGESTNENLVESTIELAVEDLVPSKRQGQSWNSKFGRKLIFAGTLVAAVATGAVGKRIQSNRALRHDLEELAIAEHHEAYKLGDDFSLYRELMYNQRWQQMIDTMERLGQREMMSPVVVDAIPVEERAESLAGLANPTREKLLGRWETYNAYSEETKSKMRAVAAKLSQADDREKLLQTMKAASVWLEGLSVEIRDQIRSGDQAIRTQAISHAIDLTLMELGRESGKLINENTSGRVYLWLQVLLQQRMDENDYLADRIRQWKKMARGSEHFNEEWVDYFLLKMLVSDFDPRRGFRGPSSMFGGGFRLPGMGGGPGGPKPPPERPGENRPGVENQDPARRMPLPIAPITDEEYQILKNDILTQKARTDLLALTSLSTELSGDDEGPVNAILRLWAIEAVRRNRPDMDQEKTPLDRYQERTDRDELDLMSPDEIMSEIYLRREWRSWQQRRRNH